MTLSVDHKGITTTSVLYKIQLLLTNSKQDILEKLKTPLGFERKEGLEFLQCEFEETHFISSLRSFENLPCFLYTEDKYGKEYVKEEVDSGISPKTFALIYDEESTAAFKYLISLFGNRILVEEFNSEQFKVLFYGFVSKFKTSLAQFVDYKMRYLDASGISCYFRYVSQKLTAVVTIQEYLKKIKKGKSNGLNDNKED